MHQVFKNTGSVIISEKIDADVQTVTNIRLVFCLDHRNNILYIENATITVTTFEKVKIHLFICILCMNEGKLSSFHTV